METAEHTSSVPPKTTDRGSKEAGASRQGDSAAWLIAYEAIQCGTAEAHAVYLQTMAQCHLAFVRAAEQSAMALASLAVGPSAHAPSSSRGIELPSASPAKNHQSFAMALPAVPRSPPAHAPAPAPPMVRRPAPRAPTPVAVSDAGVAPIPSPAPLPAPAAVVRAPAPAPVPPVPVLEVEGPRAAVATPGALVMPAGDDLKTFLFNVISEKTGYPVEILNLDQELEADLGIDSIKRVEILSVFESQIPDIKDVNLEEVASLSTLRDVVGFMEKFSDKLGLPKIE